MYKTNAQIALEAAVVLGGTAHDVVDNADVFLNWLEERHPIEVGPPSLQIVT